MTSYAVVITTGVTHELPLGTSLNLMQHISFPEIPSITQKMPKLVNRATKNKEQGTTKGSSYCQTKQTGSAPLAAIPNKVKAPIASFVTRKLLFPLQLTTNFVHHHFTHPEALCFAAKLRKRTRSNQVRHLLTKVHE